MTVSRFETLVKAAVAPGAERIMAGAVFAAANSAGLQYLETFGTTTSEPDAPALLPDAALRMESCTKVVTTIAALQCAEKGLIGLDEDVVRLVPELDNVTVLKGFGDDGEPIVQKPREKITMRQLLTHTSGFAYADHSPPLARALEARGVDLSTVNGDFEKMTSGPLLFEPSEGWTYGTGFEIVGRMIVRATGHERLGQYFDKHIFAPLGMKDSAFKLQHDRQDLKRRLMPTSKRTSHGLVVSDAEWKADEKEERGGGGLVSTAPDFMILLRAILCEDPRLLSQESYLKLHQAGVTSPTSPMSTSKLLSGYEKNAPIPAEELTWGHGLLGPIAERDVDGWLRKGTVHWCGIRNLFWFIDPASDLVTFMATQTLPYQDVDITRVEAAFHAEMLTQFGRGLSD